MITVQIFDEELDGFFTKDTTLIEVEKFCEIEVRAAMEAAKWSHLFPGRRYFALNLGKPGLEAGILFSVEEAS